MENKDKILVIYDLDQLTKLQYKHINIVCSLCVSLDYGLENLKLSKHLMSFPVKLGFCPRIFYSVPNWRFSILNGID